MLWERSGATSLSLREVFVANSSQRAIPPRPVREPFCADEAIRLESAAWPIGAGYQLPHSRYGPYSKSWGEVLKKP